MHELSKLSALHKAALRRIVAGERVGRVAADLGCHRDTITNAKQSAAGRAYLDRLEAQMDEMAVQGAVALPILRELDKR